jgi:predicted nucleic acid-binding protein
VIVDASVMLRAFFPDEEGHSQAQALVHRHVLGTAELRGPTLLSYEVTNAVLQAVRRQRITLELAQEILTTFEALAIPLDTVSPFQPLVLAHRHNRSVYDAAYLALAETLDTQLVTGDRRLYNAVFQQLPWVLWVGDDRFSAD